MHRGMCACRPCMYTPCIPSPFEVDTLTQTLSQKVFWGFFWKGHRQVRCPRDPTLIQICCFSFCLGCNNIRRTEIMLWACSCLQSILKDLLANSEAKACSFLLSCIYTVIHGWWTKIGQTYWIHTVFLFLKNDLMPLNIAEGQMLLIQWGR